MSKRQHIRIYTAAALVPLLLALAAPRTGAAQQSPQADVVCRVNGAEIRRGQVEEETRRLLPWGSFHGKIDDVQHQTMRREALEALVDAELKYQDAQRRELDVSEREMREALDEVIARYPDKADFEARMSRSGISLDTVNSALRRQRMIEKAEKQVEKSEPEVTSEDARSYYDENAARFRGPKQAVVRQILIRVPPLERSPDDWQAAVDRAAAARARIEAGASFADVAKEVSEAPEREKANGGLLGPVHPDQLEPALDAALWSIPEGGMSEPVRTFKGVYLLKVDRILPARQLEFAEVEGRLRATLGKERRRQRVESWLAGLRDAAEIEFLDPALAPGL